MTGIPLAIDPNSRSAISAVIFNPAEELLQWMLAQNGLNLKEKMVFHDCFALCAFHNYQIR